MTMTIEQIVEKSPIEADHREAVLDILGRYRPHTSGRKPEEDYLTGKSRFFERYVRIYAELPESSLKRELFVRGMQKITELANGSAAYVSNRGNNGLSVCSSFLGMKIGKYKPEKKSSSLPDEAFECWVDGLDHLRVEIKDTDAAQRLGKYLETSQENLEEYHPSHLHVLRGLRDLREGAEVYGVEDLLFSLAKRRQLDEKATKKYFGVLRKTPLEARRIIERTKGRLLPQEREQFYEQVYDVLAYDQSSQSRLEIMRLIEVLGKDLAGKELTTRVSEVGPIIERVLTEDSRMMSRSAQRAVELLTGFPRFGSEVISPYFGIVGEVAGLGNSEREEKKVYVDLAAELIRDGRSREEDALEGVRKGALAYIREIAGLPKDAKAAALEIVRKGIRRIDRKIRLTREECVFSLGDLCEIVVPLVKRDAGKALGFFNSLLDYKGAEEDG